MKKIYGFAIASAALMLASCSSDVANEPVQPEGEAAGYLKLAFDGMPSETRAGEIDVNSVKLYFYQGNTLVQTVSIPDSQNPEDNKFITGNETHGDKCMVVKLEKIPDNVVAVVNGDADFKAHQDNIATAAKMASSATRFENGGVTYKTAVPVNAIYKLQDKATANDANCVTINVERLVAMTTVDASSATIGLKDKEGEFDGYKITFDAKVAYINGVAEATSVYKPLTLSSGGLTIQGKDVAANLLSYTNAKGQVLTHWTNNTWSYNDAAVNGVRPIVHYGVQGDHAGNTTTKQADKFIYENAPLVGTPTKDFTHVIVAGQYKLEAVGNATPVEEGSTFYVFGVSNNKPAVYTTEEAVVKAMGGAAGTKLEAVKINEGRTTVAMKLEGGSNDVTCQRYDASWVYYATPVALPLGSGENAVTVNGIVRNHQYTINVQAINGLGTPVQDKNEDIIPEEPTNGDSYNMQLSIKIAPFYEVTPQTPSWN